MPPYREKASLFFCQRLRFGVMGLGCLVAVLVFGGCNVRQFFGGESAPEKFWAGVRPAGDETERLLRNFRYLKAVGRTQLALRELEEAYHREPDNIKIIDILAQCYEELGAWNRAEELYLKALAKDKDNPALANNLCFSYYQAGRYDKAEACFRDLLSRHPQNTAIRNNLGLVLVKTGRQDEAYRLWRENECEAKARELLNQALAAVGKAPQAEVARLPKPETKPGIGTDTAAAAPVAASAPTPPRPGPAPAAWAGQSTQSSALKAAENSGQPKIPEKSGSRQASQEMAVAQAPLPAKPTSLATLPKEKTTSPSLGTESGNRQAEPLKKPESSSVKNAPATVPAKVAATPTERTKPVQPVPAAKTTAAPLSHESPRQPSSALAKPVPKMTEPAAQAPKPVAENAATPAGKAVKVAAPKPAPVPEPEAARPAPPKSKIYLTAQELIKTRLEIRNGNGVKGIADLSRTWLMLEGFTVTAIGNHVDFGVAQTVIQYQAGAERVAQRLKEDFFPQADLKLTGKLGKDADVRIILGHDQKARVAEIGERIAYLDLKAQLAMILAPSGQPQAKSPATPVSRARTKAPQPPETAPAVSPVPAATEPEGIKPPNLTAAELAGARIELRNGNGVQGQARLLRSELGLHGFKVVRIKNHIDFGMDQTTILFRPDSRQVAQALHHSFFKTAKLEESPGLPQGVDVKVVLGHDLKGHPGFLAQLAH